MGAGERARRSRRGVCSCCCEVFEITSGGHATQATAHAQQQQQQQRGTVGSSGAGASSPSLSAFQHSGHAQVRPTDAMTWPCVRAALAALVCSPSLRSSSPRHTCSGGGDDHASSCAHIVACMCLGGSARTHARTHARSMGTPPDRPQDEAGLSVPAGSARPPDPVTWLDIHPWRSCSMFRDRSRRCTGEFPAETSKIGGGVMGKRQPRTCSQYRPCCRSDTISPTEEEEGSADAALPPPAAASSGCFSPSSFSCKLPTAGVGHRPLTLRTPVAPDEWHGIAIYIYIYGRGVTTQRNPNAIMPATNRRPQAATNARCAWHGRPERQRKRSDGDCGEAAVPVACALACCVAAYQIISCANARVLQRTGNIGGRNTKIDSRESDGMSLARHSHTNCCAPENSVVWVSCQLALA
jgi:hypothetical protein